MEAGITSSKGVLWMSVLSDMGASKGGGRDGPDALRHYDLRQGSGSLLDRSNMRFYARLEGGHYDASSDGGTPIARSIRDLASFQADVASQSCTFFSQGLFGIVFSGDHSAATGIIAGLQRAHPSARLGIVWIDAHADMHTPHTSTSGNMHGMPLGALTRDTSLDNPYCLRKKLPKKVSKAWRTIQTLNPRPLCLNDMVFVGLRSVDKAERYRLDHGGALEIDVAALREQGVAAAVARIKTHLAGYDKVYISFDVDSLDPSEAPATGTPVEGGLRCEEAKALHEALLKDTRVCGWGCTELNPRLPHLAERDREATIEKVWRIFARVAQVRLGL